MSAYVGSSKNLKDLKKDLKDLKDLNWSKVRVRFRKMSFLQNKVRCPPMLGAQRT